MPGDHKWNYNSGACDNCGITETDWLNGSTWEELFCHGMRKEADCCSAPSKVFLAGKWICENCDKNNIFGHGFKQIREREEEIVGPKVKKCTCGAQFRGTPDKHYIWCELEED